MSEATVHDDAANSVVLESRRKANWRLALLFGGIALGIFFMALWKFRPI